MTRTKHPAWLSALRKWMPLMLMANGVMFAVDGNWLAFLFLIMSYLAQLINEPRERQNSPTEPAAAPQA